MSHFDQARAEGLCLRYPENLGQHGNMTYDMALGMLTKAYQVSHSVPYQWGWIDRPNEGQTYLIFMPPNSGFPNDGVRYQEADTRYSIPGGNSTKELEITESKYGFIPSNPQIGFPSPDTAAWRVRRRYRLTKGGHPQLVLVHYARGNPAPINPSLAAQPIRSYPLRQVSEPPLYVIGDKVGQKAYPAGAPAHGQQPQMGAGPGGGMGGMGGGVGQIGMQNMLAQQNREMEALERRGGQRQGRGMAPGPGPGGMGGVGAGPIGTGPPAGAQQRQAPRVDDDDSGDEADQISTRSLALTRYKRNHEHMNEVFQYAAFGDPTKRASGVKGAEGPDTKLKTPFSIFDKNDMEGKTAKLELEIASLRAQADDRRTRRERVHGGVAAADVTMEGIAV
ncbi:hypothetical protein FIBSPDRAFT_1052009 [Athelia psychrophila]|uniref:SWI/SNF and RSC complexes subunit Ssr4 N-terminal domain-containing protein n=1 Tax=Athelia psychrophila TaxID=1759441 RepID=A0A165Y213_9AGAM|nr:hypothetical protein FIBSPDRAFT_1052009 [Fibularhizoctonia sp. CBS 109695]